MGQYVFISGSNFGRGHISSTTYKVVNHALRPDGVTSTSGSIYLNDGAGNYTDPATGISKADFDAGLQLLFDDNFITSSIVEVENGSCAATKTFAVWGTSGPQPASGFVSCSVSLESSAVNTSVTYRFSAAINGYYSAQRDVTDSSTAGYTSAVLRLFTDGSSIDGGGTITITRVRDNNNDPDTTPDQSGTIAAADAITDSSTLTTSYSPSNPSIPANPGSYSQTITLSNWDDGSCADIQVQEGTA